MKTTMVGFGKEMQRAKTATILKHGKLKPPRVNHESCIACNVLRLRTLERMVCHVAQKSKILICPGWKFCIPGSASFASVCACSVHF